MLACAVVVAGVNVGREARADGNQAHGQTLVQQAAGLGAAAFGVGLAGRQESGGATVPKTTADITVAGLPAGAIIEHAYLYWITYGTAGNASITLDGTATTGTPIGKSAGTCWGAYATFENFTYRADVTARVTGNAVHTLTGFPSGTPTADTQGATLFVVYRDPAVALNGGVVLYDGAITLFQNGSVSNSFTQLQLPSPLLAAHFLIGGGDGQSLLADGTVDFKTVPLTAPAAGHWANSAGNYWDDRSYDVLNRTDAPSRLKSSDTTVTWNQTYTQDCVAWAYSAITFQSPAGTGPVGDGGAGDGGGTAADGGGTAADGGGDDGGSGGGGTGAGTEAGTGGGTGGGGSDASSSGDNAPGATAGPVGSSDGCGCIASSASSHGPTAAVVAVVIASFIRRRRRGS